GNELRVHTSKLEGDLLPRPGVDVGDDAQTGIGGGADVHDAGGVRRVADPEGRRRLVALAVPDGRATLGRLNGLDLEAGAVRCPAVGEVTRRGGIAVEVGGNGGLGGGLSVSDSYDRETYPALHPGGD